MKIIRPITIDDSKFISSSLPETDFAAWSSATTYAVADKVIKAHRIWQSVQASNLNHDPETSGVSWWADVAPTNQRAMFDGRVSTRSIGTNSITVVLRPGRINSLALFNVDAAQVEFTMTVGGEIIRQRTISMFDPSVVNSWSTYFYEPIRQRRDMVLTDIPVFGEAEITITLSRTSGTVACGMLVVGLVSDLGKILSGAKISINDFSKVVDDGYGGLYLQQGEWAKRAEVKLVLPSSEVDRVQYQLADYRATPLAWIGAGGKFQSLLIFGKYDSFDVDIEYTDISYCSITIRGLI